MQIVILAGGYGTRLAEETDRIPKPMVTIGSRPILWHIMKIYAHFGASEFIICGGYKSQEIVSYFANYRLHHSDVTLDLGSNTIRHLSQARENWKVTIVNTGEATKTGGRLRRVRNYLDPAEPFCMTYGDAVSDIDVGALVDYHRQRGFAATLTAVRPPARFGATVIENGRVVSFSEKPIGSDGYINGGFFVLDHSVFDLLDGDETVWEQGPLETLARRRTLGAFVHDGFWHPMDTLRDRRYLEQQWNSGNAPWKRWNE
jgi:glucose-1-phosphate cytidylyltransferase